MPEAEAAAVLCGLQMAPEDGFTILQVETDSLSLVHRVTMLEKDLSYLGPIIEDLSYPGAIIEDISGLSSLFSSFSFKFILRQCNKLGHEVAHLAKHSIQKIALMEEVLTQHKADRRLAQD